MQMRASPGYDGSMSSLCSRGDPPEDLGMAILQSDFAKGADCGE